MRASPLPACFALTHPPAYGTKAIGSLTQSQAEAGQLWPPTLTSTGSASTQQTWWQVDWGHCRWRYPKTVLSRQNFQGWGGEKGTKLILVLLRNRRCRLAVWGVEEVGEHWGDDTATCVFWEAWSQSPNWCQKPKFCMRVCHWKKTVEAFRLLGSNARCVSPSDCHEIKRNAYSKFRTLGQIFRWPYFQTIKVQLLINLYVPCMKHCTLPLVPIDVSWWTTTLKQFPAMHVFSILIGKNLRCPAAKQTIDVSIASEKSSRDAIETVYISSMRPKTLYANAWYMNPRWYHWTGNPGWFVRSSFLEACGTEIFCKTTAAFALTSTSVILAETYNPFTCGGMSSFYRGNRFERGDCGISIVDTHRSRVHVVQFHARHPMTSNQLSLDARRWTQCQVGGAQKYICTKTWTTRGRRGATERPIRAAACLFLFYFFSGYPLFMVRRESGCLNLTRVGGAEKLSSNHRTIECQTEVQVKVMRWRARHEPTPNSSRIGDAAWKWNWTMWSDQIATSLRPFAHTKSILAMLITFYRWNAVLTDAAMHAFAISSFHVYPVAMT